MGTYRCTDLLTSVDNCLGAYSANNWCVKWIVWFFFQIHNSPCSVKFVNKCVYRWPSPGIVLAQQGGSRICDALWWCKARFYIFLPIFDFTFFKRVLDDNSSKFFQPPIHTWHPSKPHIAQLVHDQTTGFAGVSSVPMLSLSRLWESFDHSLMLDDGVVLLSHVNVDDGNSSASPPILAPINWATLKVICRNWVIKVSRLCTLGDQGKFNFTMLVLPTSTDSPLLFGVQDFHVCLFHVGC